MDAAALFWLTVGPALAACVFALLADAFASPGSDSPGIIVGALLIASGGAALVGGATVAPSQLYGVFVVGGGPSTASGVILVLAGLAVAATVRGQGTWRGRVAVLAALAATGAVLAASSVDLLITLLALETVSICAYALVGSARTRRSSEAAVKYFIQGAVATGVFVTGLAILGAITRGDLVYETLGQSVEIVGVAVPVLAAFGLVAVALAFKVGLAPFHSWAPDAYETAPPAASAVLAGPVKLAAGAALALFVVRAVPVAPSVFASGSTLGDLIVLLGVVAILSMIVGSLGALGQTSYTRMLGYAGIAQAGYAVIAVISLNPGAALIQLVMYAVAATAAFTAAYAVSALRPSWDGSVEGLRGLAPRHPWLAAAVTLSMMSLVGIPPLAGFWGKFQGFGAAVSAASALAGKASGGMAWFYLALVVVGVASSIVSVAYYGSVVRAMYFGPSSDEQVDTHDDVPDTSRSAMAVTVTLGALLLLIGLAPFLVGFEASIRPFAL